jgi:hypothetical protein
MPTISPKACGGGPSRDNQCRQDQVCYATCQHPSPRTKERNAIAEGGDNLKNSFSDEEGNNHERQRDDPLDGVPEQQDTHEQRGSTASRKGPEVNVLVLFEILS